MNHVKWFKSLQCKETLQPDQKQVKRIVFKDHCTSEGPLKNLPIKANGQVL